jgi:hypothetical protein
MANKAVCEYSNKESSTFNEYQLPYLVVCEEDDQILTEEGTLYSLTPTEEWTRVDDNDNNGRTIDPIEWTGGDEEFSVKITDEEVKTLMDDNKEIRYEKVFEWCLPRFEDDNQTLFEYQAARMRNYMTKRIVEDTITKKKKKNGLQAIMLQGFMVLVLLKCWWAIDPFNRSFAQEKSLMLYHRFKNQ